MRELKFRAWDGEKIIAQDNLYWNGDYFITGLWNREETHIIQYEQKVEIMQYTGLNDKNGVEIFEGDIVKERFFPIGENKDVIEYYFLLQVMPWRKAKIRVEGRTILDESRALSHHSTMRKRYQNTRVGSEYPCSIEWTSTKNIEVIGNIYENGDLLEGCTGLACN